MKFSEGVQDITQEIKTLVTLTKTKSKIFGKGKEGLVPKIMDYGMMVMENVTRNSNQ